MKSGLSSKDLTKTILLLAGGVLLIPALAVSPGLGYALRPFLKNYYPSRIDRTIKRLSKQKLISIDEQDGQVVIQLSEKGKRKILSYKLEEMELKTGKWDGWWRFVVFDIPERKRVARNFLRLKLKELDFYMLQKSVVVTPWNCRNEIDFLRHFYQVEDHVNLLLVKNFDEEGRVRAHFQL